MTTTVIRPTATFIDHADWVRTGGATKHGVVSDDSDATFLSNSTSPGGGVYVPITFDLGTFALGTGRGKTLTVRVRAKYVGIPQPVYLRLLTDSGTVVLSETVMVTTSGFAVYSASPVPFSNAVEGGATEQLAIDGLRVRVEAGSPGGGIVVDVAEAYVDVNFAAIPVANITYPTGTPAITTTNKPIYIWTHTPGSDGGAQSFFEVKVYTAAQYGAGGFDPDTSATFYTSGVTVGAATSHESGVLTNSTTYRVYVRTAQTINGVAQWSAWDFEGFSISVTTSDVSAITTTADNTNGRILVAVDRSGSAWDFVEVQKSLDAGTTWEYMRGGLYVPPATATVFSTGDANNFDIYDYELANAQTALYRARATRIVSGLPITGAWVQSTPAISWTSTSTFLKNPLNPLLNQTVIVNEFPPLERPVRQSALQVLNRADPVVVSDARRQLAVGSVTLITLDEADADDLFALIEPTNVLLFQSPSTDRFGSRYLAVGNITETRGALNVGVTTHLWTLPFVEVLAPADPLAGSP